MARAYTVGTVALAMNVPAKWVDNILSHYHVQGVAQKRQGVSRKVGLDGLLQLTVGLALTQDLKIPISHALHLADILTRDHGHHQTPAGIRIDLDLARLRSELEVRIAQAVEIAPIPKRGRPPQRRSGPPSKTGRLD